MTAKSKVPSASAGVHKQKSRSRLSIGAVRSPESTEAILKAAADILEENGYKDFTLDAVVARAGASKPTIYRWWGSKAALIREVYELSGEASLVIPSTGSLEQDLNIHLGSLWNWWRTTRSGEALRSFITEIQLKPESLEEFRKIFLPRRERSMRRIFDQALARGEIKDATGIEAAASMLTGLSWLHLLTGNLEATQQIEQGVKIVAQGLKAP
ncbi:Bacterial regulatory proteins, tetR family [Klebsiella pneumoniae]|uniref:TetR/AcrR family transcriptional regulator n=1 Tax=Enterobacteriaceae TaxID=543 RepID=UPI000CDDECB7|nr:MULTISPECIES: TetR/AcrR family transcriptional regulator [Enterobacteriaceae]EKV3580592.1 TetR/AcrR family transcriptional regulator [Enterobacter ludwigii]ELA0066897.1 TetR/AcrR family transcriptional regulator [Klebsiella aerogenes]POU58271.1 TetR family transcriptional regulator [Klebsiella aerogenes]RRF16504.1 TetR/AcrR family transcriptional regulator [Klebsiella pneumoniae]SVS88805.1 Bacterial regulatory proteins, tetR family [Klebsiella pneumoniae]